MSSTAFQSAFQDLKTRLNEVIDLRMAGAVLSWDQNVLLPEGGGAARARQLATLERLAHEALSRPELGLLLKTAERELSSSNSAFEKNFLKIARREYDRATRVPNSFQKELTEHFALSYQTWVDAKRDANFSQVAGLLEKSIDYAKRYADFFPGYENPADPLMDPLEPGARASEIKKVFNGLRSQLVPLVKQALSKGPAEISCLKRHKGLEQELIFADRVAAHLGYDFKRGRRDLAPHPFCTSFSLNDVRITSRGKEEFLGEAFFSTLHEAGHAMYEQGIDPATEGTVLAAATGMAVHESQSRLWENIVGRSRDFWTYWYPQLQQVFPQELTRVGLDTFLKAINRSEASFIRTEADELTYNLHVMIRFDLEQDLLLGRLKVKDLPEAWNARYQSDLGITPPSAREGVLQDIHWFIGFPGSYFFSYTMGNILSVQFFEAAKKAYPQIPEQLRGGDASLILKWMRENIHFHGNSLTTDELVKQSTGQPMTYEPYLNYLRTKSI